MKPYPAFVLATAAFASTALAVDPPAAFVGAQGFGAIATGGRGGDVYHVTNLNDAGPGSLRFGLDNAPSAGRTIVFEVGGWIDLQSRLGITRDRITIAGQTAPGGIGLRGDQLSVGGDDIVIRHIRSRPGFSAGRVDAGGANIDAERVIYDHVSLGFAIDEVFSTRANDLTLQYSSVAFGLENRQAGSLIDNGAGNLSFHHNVYAHNDTRNPKARAELIDWRDNVVYNYNNGFIAGDSLTTDFYWRTNFDGNTYVSDRADRPMMTGGRDFNYGLWYGNNAHDADGDGVADAVLIDRDTAQGDQRIISSSYTWADDPFAAPPVWQNEDAFAAYEWTLQQFGATPWARDAVDELTAEQVRTRTGSRIFREGDLPIAPYPTLGGQPAPADVDRDGMADAWEVVHGLQVGVMDNNGDFDNDGYTNVEEYLMDLAPFPAPGPIAFVGNTIRWADSRNWTHNWQPSTLDVVNLDAGEAFVDAVGQHAGTLLIDPAAGDVARLNVTSGWLRVSDTLQVGGDGGGDAGVVLLGGTLQAERLTGNGGVLLFGGTLDVDTIAPGLSTGTLTFVGNLSLDGVRLEMEVAADAGDRLEVSGTVELGGTLDVSGLDGFAPGLGQEWLLIDADGLTGDFESVTDGFTLRRDGGSLYLVSVIPEPGGLGALAVAGLAGLRRR